MPLALIARNRPLLAFAANGYTSPLMAFALGPSDFAANRLQRLAQN
jgi:hypothetical protein